jgi:hypothetical protein
MIKFLDWAILIMGLALVFGGYRAIKKRSTNTDVGEYEGDSAVKLGWFWIVLGALFVLSIVFDIGIIKSAAQFFLDVKP